MTPFQTPKSSGTVENPDISAHTTGNMSISVDDQLGKYADVVVTVGRITYVVPDDRWEHSWDCVLTCAEPVSFDTFVSTIPGQEIDSGDEESTYNGEFLK